MIKIKFWGVTGSLPSPMTQKSLKDKLIYAILETGKKDSANNFAEAEAIYESLPNYVKHVYIGNTPCVEIQGLGDYFILDAGSGLRELGLDMLKRKEGSKTINLFLTHFHWDHIMGFPFFVPAYLSKYAINFYSGHPDPEKRMAEQQYPTHFPVELQYMGAYKSFFTLNMANSIVLNDTKISIFPLRHPGGSYSYRFDFKNGKSLVYATDGEYPTKEMSEDKFHQYANFFQDADLLIFDAMYTFSESETNKEDWGHSSPNMGIELAIEGNVKHLALFHHEPAQNDKELYLKYEAAKKYRDIYIRNFHPGKQLKISLALESGVIEL